MTIQCDLRSLWDLVRPLLPPEAVVQTWVSCRRIGAHRPWFSLCNRGLRKRPSLLLKNEAFALLRFQAWDVALLLRPDRRDSTTRCYKHLFYTICIHSEIFWICLNTQCCTWSECCTCQTVAACVAQLIVRTGFEVSSLAGNVPKARSNRLKVAWSGLKRLETVSSQSSMTFGCSWKALCLTCRPLSMRGDGLMVLRACHFTRLQPC